MFDFWLARSHYICFFKLTAKHSGIAFLYLNTGLNYSQFPVDCGTSKSQAKCWLRYTTNKELGKYTGTMTVHVRIVSINFDANPCTEESYLIKW